MERRILLTECQDAVGIIAKITNVCFQFKLNIIRQDQFASQEDNKFFMRTVLEGDFTNETTIDAFINTVKVVLPEGAIVHLKDDHKKKLCVLVKCAFQACFYRWYYQGRTGKADDEGN